MPGRPPKRTRRSRLNPIAPSDVGGFGERRWGVPQRMRWASSNGADGVGSTDELKRMGLSEALRSAVKTQPTLTIPESWPEDNGATDHRSDDEITDALYRHLRAGRTSKASGVVQLLLLAGRTVPQVIDGSFQMALSRLGEDWNGYDSGDACWEHRALEISLRILRQLPSGNPTGERTLRAVGGAPENDPYIVPAMSVATVLEANGFDVTNLGRETPTSTLVRTIRQERPALVFLSLTALPDVQRTRDTVAEILETADSVGARMIVGGQQLQQLRPHDHPGLAFGRSMVELAAFASGMPRRD